MNFRNNHTALLRYAGLFTWAMVGIPVVLRYYGLLIQGPEAADTSPMLSLIAFAVFGAAYWLVTHDLGARRPRWYDQALLAILTISAISLTHLMQSGLGAILLMITAAVIPWLLPMWLAIAWLILQHLILVPIFHRQDFTWMEAFLQASLYVGYGSFAFVTSWVAKQQAMARDEQRRLNSELRATRALLAESTRMSERIRISRELHDLLGHHLTALSLNLEVAGHLTEGKAQEHVKQSHTLAKLLLTDVREAVSVMREDGAVDFANALKTLIDGVPSLNIHLNMPEPFMLTEPERAHVLLRCAQEAITNAVRHAGAENFRLDISVRENVIEMTAQDDGRGCDALSLGNGLRGMRERLQEYGGTVEIDPSVSRGFALKITLPMEIRP
jgi:signal transduction histidine kinase